MIDIEIKNEVLPVIAINFDEVKKALAETMDQYTGIIVTEESLSACKAEQKELAGIRTKIDSYRKDKKKELSKPITDFENQCKELIALIEKAERPIKEGIAIFDDKKKEEKRQKALAIIKETIESHQLREKFADKLTVLDKYMNLTASIKAVKEDIEQRAFFLVEEQAKEDETIQVIQTTIENVNKGIRTPVKYEDFKNLVDGGYPVPKIIERINQMAEKIKLAENPPKVEPKEVIEEIKSPVSGYQQAPPIQQQTSMMDKHDEQLYYVTFKIIGDKNKTAALGDFLRKNGYKYEVIDKGAVK